MTVRVYTQLTCLFKAFSRWSLCNSGGDTTDNVFLSILERIRETGETGARRRAAHRRALWLSHLRLTDPRCSPRCRLRRPLFGGDAGRFAHHSQSLSGELKTSSSFCHYRLTLNSQDFKKALYPSPGFASRVLTREVQIPQQAPFAHQGIDTGQEPLQPLEVHVALRRDQFFFPFLPQQDATASRREQHSRLCRSRGSGETQLAP